MRRTLTIIVLAVVLVIALSVPVLAAPSDTPNAWGKYNSEWASWAGQNGSPWGRDFVRWTHFMMWYNSNPEKAWGYPLEFGAPYTDPYAPKKIYCLGDAGEYIADAKEWLSTTE